MRQNSLVVDNVSVSLGGVPILKDVSFDVGKGDFVALIGPNGSGKTTLLKTLSGLIKPSNGRVLINGKNISSFSPKLRATISSYLPQRTDTLYPFTVEDFLLMSRYPYSKGFSGFSKEDKSKVQNLMSEHSLQSLSGRSLDQLSGGELQKVLIAGAIIQETKFCFLDEPTASLDPMQERWLLDLLTTLHTERGMTIVMSTHRIETVSGRASRVISVKSGQIYGVGDRQLLLEETFIQGLYR